MLEGPISRAVKSLMNRSRMFAVVRWMRRSTMFSPPPNTPVLSNARLQFVVPAPNTQAPLGAW